MGKVINTTQRVFIIRHAESTYNEAVKGNVLKKLSAKHDPALLDAPLSDVGKQQTLEGQQNALQHLPNVDVVFVSPMKRTLQTAFEIFKVHPNFKNIKFICVPDLKEHLQCTCDIPGQIMPLMEEFRPKFPNFDYSFLDKVEGDKNLWFLDTLEKGDEQRIRWKIQDQPEVSYEQHMFHEIKNWKERYPSKKRRVDKIRRIILDKLKEMDQEQLNEMAHSQGEDWVNCQNPKQIGVVGHSQIFKILLKLPKTSMESIKNCEFKCVDHLLEKKKKDVGVRSVMGNKTATVAFSQPLVKGDAPQSIDAHMDQQFS